MQLFAVSRQSPLPYCGNIELVEPPGDDLPEAKPSYEACTKALPSVISQGKMARISEKDEDLGLETIQGLEARRLPVNHRRSRWCNHQGSMVDRIW